MKKLLIATLVAGAVVVLLALTWIPAHAQPRSGGGSGPDLLMLQGPGSTIGVVVRDLEGDEASKAKTDGAGVYVREVRAGTAAEKAGFKPGDIIVDFDGERVRSARHFTRLVRETPPGRTVKSTVVRDGNRRTVDVTPQAPERFALDRFPDFSREIERGLRNMPRDFAFDFDFDAPGVITTARGRLGATLMSMNDQLSDYFGVKNGVLVSAVDAESAAAKAGLKAGDVITAVNGSSVDRPGDVTRAIRDAGNSKVELRVTREKKELTLEVTVPDRAPARALRGRGVPL